MKQELLFREEYRIASLRPLRPYQEKAIDAIRQAIKEGHKRIILQAPTGAGKSLLAAHIIAAAMYRMRRPIFTCPAITLVDQTLKAFEREGIRDIGIMQARHIRTDRLARLQVASVQTLIRRELPEVDLVIIDEVHIGFDGLNERLDGPWENKIVIGLSATPWAKGMGLRWTKLIIASTIQELIDDGYLSPFQVYVPANDFDRSQMKVKMGEFTEASASQAMSRAAIIGDVVRTWKEKSTGEKTFMFCVNRAHAKEQMGAFIDSGIPFGYIDAETDMAERTRQFAKMKYGEIAGIASVGCLIAGVDEDVRNIIDAAPTKSEMRHVQKIGRGLRPADGKQKLCLLDHAGNTLELGLVTDIYHDRLDTRKPGEKGEAFEGDKRPPKPKKCVACNALIPKGRVSCPACGMVVKVTSDVMHGEGELQIYGSSKKAEKREYTHEEKQEFYSGILWLCRERGNSEGMAAHRYREKFGVWPRNLAKISKPPSFEVEKFDRHCRIKWAKSLGVKA